MSKKNNLLILVEGAMLIAVATVLSYLKIFEMPFGGSITLEMLPLIIMGLRRGAKWGVLTGFVHGLIQMIIGFSNVMYCNTLLAQAGCILLDYLLAFSVLGLALIFARFLISKNKVAAYVTGSVIVCVLRFICSFLSGWLLWGSYAPEGMAAPVYSFLYNGAYMLPDTIIVAVVIAILAAKTPKLFVAEK